MEDLSHPGIPDIYALDIVGKRRDGGVELAIVVSQHLDASENSQHVLLAKMENYLGFRNSDEFREEFGELEADQVCIVVCFAHTPDPAIIELLGRCDGWVAENNARIRYEIQS
jgi:hypothetical protein